MNLLCALEINVLIFRVGNNFGETESIYVEKKLKVNLPFTSIIFIFAYVTGI